MNFNNAFNVGLTLDTDIKEFDGFLQSYHPYIKSVYFSLPLGMRFHTRIIIAEQMMLPHKVRLFWLMLDKLREYGIELELLFNTLCLDDKSIAKARELLEKHDISVDSVCFLGRYYESVVKYFPDKKYIWSFNNGLRSSAEFDKIIGRQKVDTVVLGSNFIRDDSFFRHVKEQGKEILLLLNNGCSFNCATCNNTGSCCQKTFERNLKEHSVEYLYALQSIFPDELYDGTIDASHIDYFKISNRGNKLSFLREAMDSYINRRVRCYLDKDCNSYAYWGRAGYFWKYFPSMRLDKIIEYKQSILQHPFNVE